ncbi:hypothetical protein [Herpetosiphon geysericola]|uniref:Uncharacterized protein n=1 Tax=Herpetosiphon geysericola TaxID=70996 RepID=A0A0P6Y286_9CHLR|nr:hypothetical protein [Herpetosiphon geysericola]KPL89998.1 hypothetical protein SE18_08580 [Herpetosiphon geysericola]
MAHGFWIIKQEEVPIALNLNDQSVNWKYRLELNSWQPPIPDRNPGSGEPYLDTYESFSLAVGGVDRNEVVANLNALQTILDDAADFNDGMSSTPVILREQIDGGVAYDALLFSQEPARFGITLTSDFLTDTNARFYRNVKVEFPRRPILCNSIVVNSNSPGGEADTMLSSLSFTTAADIASPASLDLAFSNLPTAAVMPTIPAGTVVIGPAESLFPFNAAPLATGTGYSSVADVANNAPLGTVMRYTPPSTSEVVHTTKQSINQTTRCLVFAKVRNNSTSAGFSIRPIATTLGGQLIYGRYTHIDEASGTSPRVISLGILSAPSAMAQLQLGITATATGLGTLDIADVFLVALDQGRTSIIPYSAVTRPNNNQGTLSINDNYVSAEAPSLGYAQSAAAPLDVFSEGDARIFLKGKEHSLKILTTNGTSWKIMPSSSGATPTVNATLKRRTASLIPR